MSINVEVTSQLLDALAFVLVTPEFLGEHTLYSIRTYLTEISAFLSRLLFARLGVIIFLALPILSGILLTASSENNLNGTLGNFTIFTMAGIIFGLILIMLWSWIFVSLAE